MPVDGESSPPKARTAGSSARTSAAESDLRSRTPLASALARMLSSTGSLASFVATMIFPSFRWGTPRSAQYA
jgi:hypothetical protein